MSGSAFDAVGATVTSLTWNFGDAGSGSGGSVSHTYTAPGTYTITLAANDSANLPSSASQTITVSAPSNAFGFGRVTLNKRKGTAKLPAFFPNDGIATVAGRGIKSITKGKVSRKAVIAGTTIFTIKPTRKTVRKLKRKGKARVTAPRTALGACPQIARTG